MKRRDFIKYGAAGATLPFWLQYCDFRDPDYPVKLNSDHQTGHLIFASKEWKKSQKRNIDVAIVGGGIAGLTAAHQLKGIDFQLYELSNSLGGTVATEHHHTINFSQGAHYDLAYPENFGNEVISLLEELNLIAYQPWQKLWGFKDKQHIIPSFRKQQCYDFGKRRKDVIAESSLKNQFVELMRRFDGKMKLPTRLIDQQYRYLNKITFNSFLRSELPTTEAFLRQVDYHMYDDYGGSSEMVSALAGIHYFACRPYYHRNVDLFSPPNGNKYFANALINEIPRDRLSTSSLVKNIRKIGNEFELQVINIEAQRVEEIRAKKVIYAGQKHALKYISPDQFSLFTNTYAPWMVVNLITNQKKGTYGYWQNEFLGRNERFLGFIDSSVQSQQHLDGKRVFTAYYCLSPEDREYLVNVEAVKSSIAHETQGYIEEMLNEKFEAEACYIKVMGHAMPIPAPNYLFQNANASSDAKLIYAGVDNGRLPLFFEALDSGIQAAGLV